MSLDLAIVDADGRPRVSVALGANDHGVLMAAAAQLGLTQTLRLQDYYTDVEFTPANLAALEAELGRVVASAQGRLRQVAAELRALCQQAARDQVSLFAIAD